MPRKMVGQRIHVASDWKNYPPKIELAKKYSAIRNLNIKGAWWVYNKKLNRWVPIIHSRRD